MERNLNGVIVTLGRLDAAISDALANEVAEAAKEAVSESAQRNVYDVYSGPMAEYRREENGGLKDPDNVITTVNGHTLTIENVTGLQNLYGGDDASPLTPIVQSGDKRYHMPFPREFMDGAKEILLSGKADAALRRGLARQGIDVSGLTFTFE